MSHGAAEVGARNTHPIFKPVQGSQPSAGRDPGSTTTQPAPRPPLPPPPRPPKQEGGTTVATRGLRCRGGTTASPATATAAAATAAPATAAPATATAAATTNRARLGTEGRERRGVGQAAEIRVQATHTCKHVRGCGWGKGGSVRVRAGGGGGGWWGFAGEHRVVELSTCAHLVAVLNVHSVQLAHEGHLPVPLRCKRALELQLSVHQQPRGVHAGPCARDYHGAGRPRAAGLRGREGARSRRREPEPVQPPVCAHVRV
jgi:hypothetical protein